MKLKTLIQVGVVAAVSVVAVSACGSASDVSDSGGSSGGSAVGASLTKTNFAQKMTEAQSGNKSFHLQGNIDMSGQSVTLSGDMSAVGGSLKDLQADMTMGMGDKGSAELRFVDGVMYLNAGDLGMSQDTSKPWMKIDMTDSSNPLGAMYSKVMSQMDPSKMTKAFKSITTLDKVGSEEVDGVDTTHYKVSVDTDKAMQAMGLDNLGAGNSQGLESMPKTMKYDVWVNGDALPVRIQTEMGGSTVDLHFSDWGQSVSVDAPPADQVSEFSF
ncbi:MAG: hypothetical protein ACRDQA_04390 [Nocardioidaceae bacterium]